jgi:hypothetical protein
VCGDVGHAEPAEVLDRRAEPDRLGDRWCARLELVRYRREGGALHGNRLDHLTAAEERWECVENIAPPPQHADAGGAAHLVPGERDQIGAELGDVHRRVRHRLRTVEKHQRTDLAGQLKSALR